MKKILAAIILLFLCAPAVAQNALGPVGPGSPPLALSSLPVQATNTVVGNATSSSAAPTALAVGSCSTAASALKWTTNTGFGCNTSITAANLTTGALGGTLTLGLANNNAYRNTLVLLSDATRLYWGADNSHPNYKMSWQDDVSGAICLDHGTANSDPTASTYTIDFCDASGLISLPQITSDVAHTDASVCEDTTTHALYSGSGTLGICLGTSTERAKADISHLPMFEALLRVMGSYPVSYHYRPGYGDNGARIQYGFVAEKMTGAFPELIGYGADGKPNSFDMFGMFSWLVRAFQALVIINVCTLFVFAAALARKVFK